MIHDKSCRRSSYFQYRVRDRRRTWAKAFSTGLIVHVEKSEKAPIRGCTGPHELFAELSGAVRGFDLDFVVTPHAQKYPAFPIGHERWTKRDERYSYFYVAQHGNRIHRYLYIHRLRSYKLDCLDTFQRTIYSYLILVSVQILIARFLI